MSRQRPQAENGQTLVLLLILIAMAGGALWYVKTSRARKEKEAWAFANDVAHRVILQGDSRILDLTLSGEAKVTYPPSWRQRMLEFIRVQGQPHSHIRLTGDVQFTNEFLDPQGHFRAELDYENGPAYLELRISHPGVLWQIDHMNWIWQRPPEPVPTPIPAASVTPSPTPTPTPVVPSPSSSKRKKR
ncbi:MAG: hypothetical protein H0T95_00725 [Chthoniobacterales bacterium]|nr:hypothetical protein [Chthoniobacterales bacterium]